MGESFRPGAGKIRQTVNPSDQHKRSEATSDPRFESIVSSRCWGRGGGLLIGGLALCGGVLEDGEMRGKRPRNVIWITTDHMRYDFVRAVGQSWVHTPNLDRLVGGGVSFDRCFGNSPVCMPSRCSFMTGCYPGQTGVMRNGQELSPDFDPVAARAFGAAGYRTVQIGKLHLQCHEDHDMDPRAREAYGFDVLELSEEPGCYEDAYRLWLRGEHPDAVEVFTVPRPTSFERRQDGREFRVIDAPWELSHSGWVATQAERYLYSWGTRPDPQFLHLGFYAPHPPLNPTHEMFDPYRGETVPDPIGTDGTRVFEPLEPDLLREYRRHFAAMVTGVDFAIGRLVAALKKNGEFDDTLLVFSSDHGDLCGDHGGISKGPSWYDGIMHLPLILHWPDGLGTEPRRVGGFFEMVDLLPTLLGLSGAAVPRAMTGRDVSGALLSGAEVPGREDVLAVYPGSLMLRNEGWKYLRYRGREGVYEVLYDLFGDPEEKWNRADDPEVRHVVEGMRARALDRLASASEPVTRIRCRF